MRGSLPWRACWCSGRQRCAPGTRCPWSYQTWAYTNGLFEGFGLALTGPVAAAFGAFLSGRLTPPTRPYAQPKFARGTARFLVQNLAPAVLVVTSAYLLALLPVVVQTYRTATAGSLDPVTAVSGVLVLNTLLVAGWLIGLFAQSAFAAPVAFGAAFAATLVGYGVNTWNAVTPVTADLGVVGLVETPAFQTFRLSFFFVVLIVALLTAGAVLTGRDFDRRPPPVRVAVLWLLPAAFLAAGIGHPPAAIKRETSPPRVCRDVNGMQFCMHKAHERDLEPLAGEVAPIIALVGKENLPFDRVHDWSLSDGRTPPADSTVFYADASPKYGVVGVGGQIADQVAGIYECAARPGREESEQGFNSFMLSLRLNGDREDRPDNRFGPLSDSQLRQWLAEHRSRVTSCDITNDLLP